MGHLKGAWPFGVVFSLALVFSGCLAGGKAPQCPPAVSPVPGWVHHVEILDDHYVGIGQAAPGSRGPFVQKQLARKRALGQLLQAIQVTVESSMELSERQGNTKVYRTVTRHLRVASQLTLKEVANAGIYQDPATCILWVRLKIGRELADNLIALKQAKELYGMSLEGGEGVTSAQALRWITEAQARLADVDFRALPKDAGNRAFLTQRFEAHRRALEAMHGEKSVWILSASPFLKASLGPCLPPLAASHGAVYMETHCALAPDCLAQAREHAGKQLVWIKAMENTTAGMLGVHKGLLTLRLERYDLASGSLLATQIRGGQAFAFDQGGLDWAALAKQLLTEEVTQTAVK